MRTLAIALLALSALTLPAHADPWKDESGARREGHSRDYDYRRDRYDRDGDYGRVPRGQLPPRGECRVWFEGRPAGQQPAPMDCRRARIIAERTGALVVTSRGRVY